MTGVTAGQAEQAQVIARAFHETYETLAPQFGYETREASAKPWEEVPEQNRKLMAATVAWLLATGEIAAQQPQPAPGDAQLRMAIAFIEQARDGAYGDLGTIDAEQSLREIADAAPAQPAPELAAVTSNRLGHALAALREIRDAHEAGAAAHDTAHAALDDDAAIRGNVQLTVQPAPGRAELETAMAAALQDLIDEDEARAESGKLRDQLAGAERVADSRRHDYERVTAKMVRYRSELQDAIRVMMLSRDTADAAMAIRERTGLLPKTTEPRP